MKNKIVQIKCKVKDFLIWIFDNAVAQKRVPVLNGLVLEEK